MHKDIKSCHQWNMDQTIHHGNRRCKGHVSDTAAESWKRVEHYHYETSIGKDIVM